MSSIPYWLFLSSGVGWRETFCQISPPKCALCIVAAVSCIVNCLHPLGSVGVNTVGYNGAKLGEAVKGEAADIIRKVGLISHTASWQGHPRLTLC